MRPVSLLEAAKRVPHSHEGQDPRHPQYGNPLYDWWEAARFMCPLCLAIMAADGTDIAFGFASQLPYATQYAFDVRWWKRAYLFTLPYVTDEVDRQWLRERLAEAPRRGKGRGLR